jgi:hypothetical protein
VQVQRQTPDGWSAVATGATDLEGQFSVALPRPWSGRYRAVAPVTSAGGRACLAATSPARRAVDSPSIVLDHSIGSLALGMTRAELVAELGRPRSTLAIALGNGETGLLARFRVHGALLIVLTDARGRVVFIETYSPFFRTVAGVGPGSSIDLVQTLPGFHQDQCDFGYWDWAKNGSANDEITVFTVSGPVVASVVVTRLRYYTPCRGAISEIAPPGSPQ